MTKTAPHIWLLIVLGIGFNIVVFYYFSQTLEKTVIVYSSPYEATK